MMLKADEVKKCIKCNEFKPLNLFTNYNRRKNRNKICKDCASYLQILMPYPILKQPSREWILNELKSIERVNKNDL